MKSPDRWMGTVFILFSDEACTLVILTRVAPAPGSPPRAVFARWGGDALACVRSWLLQRGVPLCASFLSKQAPAGVPVPHKFGGCQRSFEPIKMAHSSFRAKTIPE